MAFISHAIVPRARSATTLRPHTLCASAAAPPPAPRAAPVSRRAFLAAALAGVATAATSGLPARAAEQLEYKVVQKGSGPAPVVGDLVGIRFKGSYNGVVFDNLFEASTPYFYRVGSGNILKGIEETVRLMRVGDIFEVTLPPTLAFGSKGRRASPGKPSIPPNATVLYTVELSTIPGKEDELLENVKESDIGSSL